MIFCLHSVNLSSLDLNSGPPCLTGHLVADIAHDRTCSNMLFIHDSVGVGWGHSSDGMGCSFEGIKHENMLNSVPFENYCIELFVTFSLDELGYTADCTTNGHCDELHT